MMPSLSPKESAIEQPGPLGRSFHRRGNTQASAPHTIAPQTSGRASTSDFSQQSGEPITAA